MTSRWAGTTAALEPLPASDTMSLSLSQAKDLCAELHSSLKGCTFSRCRYCDPKRLIIKLFDKNGSQYDILICLQQPYIRFHQLSNCPSIREHPFCATIDKALSESTLDSLSLLSDDRIISAKFQRASRKRTIYHELLIELFPKKPNVYLLNDCRRVLASFFPVADNTYVLPSQPAHGSAGAAEPATSLSIEKWYNEREALDTLHHEKTLLLRKVKAQVRRSRRRQTQALDNLKNCEQWPQQEHEAQILAAYFQKLKKGMTTITLPDWEQDNIPTTLALDPSLSAQEQIDKRFRKSKKLKKGLPYALERVKVSDDEAERWSQALAEIDVTEDLDAFARHYDLLPKEAAATAKKARKTPPKQDKILHYKTQKGDSILVGKDAASNDKLTSSVANGNDWWLHVADYPGSHVVLRLKDQQNDPHPESVLDAMQIALQYSKAKLHGEATIHITQKKYVKKPKGAKPGQVLLSKHKTKHCTIDPKRYELIKQRGDQA